MTRNVGCIVGSCLVFVLTSSAGAQEVVNYPPADGMMYTLPPQYAAPGGLGSEYTETPPAVSSGTTAPNAYAAQPAAPYSYQTAPARRAIARLRAGRAARQYTRGYSQPPAPYSTALPQGQIYWPGSFMAPSYTPLSRYQTYGSGYGRGPYGSGFYSGYYKGFSLGY
jgi:hypothetical protein